MSFDDGWRTSPSGPPRGSGSGGYSARPRLGLADVILHLWRAKWLMIAVFLPIFILAVVAAYLMPVSYEATSRFQVSVGRENIYRDPFGGPGSGAVPEAQQIIDAEIELIQSPEIADRVLEKVGLDALYPDLATDIAAEPDDRERAIMREEAILGLQQEFTAWSPPKNPVIRTTFKSEDPVIAALTLNTFIETYLEYRAELFLDNRVSPRLTAQRKASEAKLSDVDRRIQQFLVGNNIGDFDTERTAVSGLYSTVTEQLFDLLAQQSDVMARLARVREQLSSMSPEMVQYTESNAGQTLLDLYVQRQQLLARYLPTSQPVLAVEAEIAEVEALLGAQQRPVGTQRTGPNETWMAIDARRAEFEAEADALRDRIAELERQKIELEARQRRLTELEPVYQSLLREQAVLEDQVRTLTVREEEERLTQETRETNFDNIQILEPARVPARGSSLRLPIAAAGFLFAGFTALMVGLLRAYTSDTFATAQSVQRTTGLQVLSSVRRHRR